VPFIAEGVRVNVVQHNLAILIYLVRMVKSLLENQTLFLEKYLHELIPAVTTCIVARQLCTRPDVDNHWALRDFASRLMTNICKNFNTSTNNIQTRITRMFSDALSSEKTPLVSCYGALAGIQEMGTEVIKSVVIPQIKAISARIDAATGPNLELSANRNLDKTAVQKITALVLNSVVPILKTTRPPPDVREEYLNEFGSLGSAICEQVQKTRKALATGTQSPSSPMVSVPRPQQQPPTSQVFSAAGGQRYVVVNNAQHGQPVIVSNQGVTQQRFVQFMPRNTN